MLDNNTLQWLEDRKCTCNRCGVLNKCVLGDSKGHVYGECYWFEIKAQGTKSGVLKEDFRDAAMFETKVAERCITETIIEYKKEFDSKFPENEIIDFSSIIDILNEDVELDEDEILKKARIYVDNTF